MTDLAGLTRTADLSPCGRFRFTLRRIWGPGPRAAWLMLNPSTADAVDDDPTLRRITDWAATWGMHGVTVVNLYPLRASKPAALWDWLRNLRDAADTDTEALAHNLACIRSVAAECAVRLVGFGADAAVHDVDHVARCLEAYGGGAMALGTNRHGWPLHPMARGKHRLPDYARPHFWEAPTALPAETV